MPSARWAPPAIALYPSEGDTFRSFTFPRRRPMVGRSHRPSGRSEPPALAVGDRTACQAAPHRPRLDAEQARPGPILQGVHQPDRARTRACVGRRPSSGWPTGWASTGRSSRRASPRPSRSGLPAWSLAPRPRLPLANTTRRSSVSGRPESRLRAGSRPGAPSAAGERDCAVGARGRQEGAHHPRAGPRSRRG